MKQPHEMTDAELNLEIAETQYPTDNGWHIDREELANSGVLFARYRGTIIYKQIDYTNNIANIFPILIELEIDLYRYFDSKKLAWGARSRQLIETVSENPIRAICECVVLVLRRKNDENT